MTGEIEFWIKVMLNWQRRKVVAVQIVVDTFAIETRQHVTLHETRCRNIIFQFIYGQEATHGVVRKVLHLFCDFTRRWRLLWLRLVCFRSFCGIYGRGSETGVFRLPSTSPSFALKGVHAFA